MPVLCSDRPRRSPTGPRWFECWGQSDTCLAWCHDGSVEGTGRPITFPPCELHSMHSVNCWVLFNFSLSSPPSFQGWELSANSARRGVWKRALGVPGGAREPSGLAWTPHLLCTIHFRVTPILGNPYLRIKNHSFHRISSHKSCPGLSDIPQGFWCGTASNAEPANPMTQGSLRGYESAISQQCVISLLPVVLIDCLIFSHK